MKICQIWIQKFSPRQGGSGPRGEALTCQLKGFLLQNSPWLAPKALAPGSWQLSPPLAGVLPPRVLSAPAS